MHRTQRNSFFSFFIAFIFTATSLNPSIVAAPTNSEGRPHVILLQDAHAIPTAQHDIARIIETYQKEQGLELIAMEGFAGKMDPTLFRAYPNKIEMRELIHSFLDKGELSGGAAAAILSPHESDYQGVEDWELYEDQINALFYALEQQPKFLKNLEKQQRELEQQQRKIYSKKLFAFNEALKKTEANPIKIAKILKQLKQYNPQMKKKQFEAKYPQLATFLKMTYLEKKQPELLEKKALKEKFGAMTGEIFYQEWETLVLEIKAGLFRNDAERELDQKQKEMEIEERLLKFELTREEWESWRGEFSDELMPFLIFYDIAVERESAMLNNLRTLLQGRSKAMLIVGGFHTAGMVKLFEEHNLSYELRTPEISEIPKKNTYLNLMQGEVSWASHFKEQDGRVDLYDAFARYLIQTLGKPKAWRDGIMQNLSEKKRMHESAKYTKYFDTSIAEKSWKPVEEAWLQRTDNFIQQLPKPGHAQAWSVHFHAQPISSHWTRGQAQTDFLALSESRTRPKRLRNVDVRAFATALKIRNQFPDLKNVFTVVSYKKTGIKLELLRPYSERVPSMAESFTVFRLWITKEKSGYKIKLVLEHRDGDKSVTAERTYETHKTLLEQAHLILLKGAAGPKSVRGILNDWSGSHEAVPASEMRISRPAARGIESDSSFDGLQWMRLDPALSVQLSQISANKNLPVLALSMSSLLPNPKMRLSSGERRSLEMMNPLIEYLELGGYLILNSKASVERYYSLVHQAFVHELDIRKKLYLLQRIHFVLDNGREVYVFDRDKQAYLVTFPHSSPTTMVGLRYVLNQLKRRGVPLEVLAAVGTDFRDAKADGSYLDEPAVPLLIDSGDQGVRLPDENTLFRFEKPGRKITFEILRRVNRELGELANFDRRLEVEEFQAAQQLLEAAPHSDWLHDSDAGNSSHRKAPDTLSRVVKGPEHQHIPGFVRSGAIDPDGVDEKWSYTWLVPFLWNSKNRIYQALLPKAANVFDYVWAVKETARVTWDEAWQRTRVHVDVVSRARAKSSEPVGGLHQRRVPLKERAGPLRKLISGRASKSEARLRRFAAEQVDAFHQREPLPFQLQQSKGPLAFNVAMAVPNSETGRQSILSELRAIARLKQERARVEFDIHLLVAQSEARDLSVKSFLAQATALGARQVVVSNERQAGVALSRFVQQHDNGLVFGAEQLGLDERALPDAVQKRLLVADALVPYDAMLALQRRSTALLATTPTLAAEELDQRVLAMLPGAIERRGQGYVANFHLLQALSEARLQAAFDTAA